jgi:hypothetical protein
LEMCARTVRADRDGFPFGVGITKAFVPIIQGRGSAATGRTLLRRRAGPRKKGGEMTAFSLPRHIERHPGLDLSPSAT